MHRTYLLIAIAFVEGGTGLVLLVLPSVAFKLLLGVEQASLEAAFVARVTGAALLSIGVACGLGRNDKPGPALLGLIAGFLLYSSAAAGLLAYAALFLNLDGIALWSAVVLHAALAVWCVVCLGASPG